MATVAGVIGAALLFALFGILQRSHRRQDVPSCACFGGTGNCATCPTQLESDKD
jgi:hypothetical protein